jgi:CubicO group peptidase (beta-lactamase class C family)
VRGLESELTEVFRHRAEPDAVPVAAAAVIEGDDLVRVGWGAGTDTLFQAASISKSVAAALALALVARRVLELDRPVNHYLRSWRLPARRRQRDEVTVRHLLCHGGGLTVSAFDGYPAEAPLPSLAQMLDGAPPANSAPVRISGKPGRKHWYSSGGYLVLQQVLEDVTGHAFVELAADLVLGPAGMTGATYAPAGTDDVAVPHVDGARAPHGPRIHPEHAAAGLWCTPADIVRFARAVQRAVAGDQEGFLPSGLAAEMVTTQLPGWGFGVLVEGPARNRSFGGVGRSLGYTCEYRALVHGVRAAAAMASSDRGKPVIRELVTVAMARSAPV